ncbi:MAG: type II toxin-antitoxin system Phd/YefM family antitoxin [Sphingomicrobium sp.]
MASREFNQDVSQAKRFAVSEPVFVTDRGNPTHVLMSMDAYRRLIGPTDSIASLLVAKAPIPIEPDWRSAGPWARRTV